MKGLECLEQMPASLRDDVHSFVFPPAPHPHARFRDCDEILMQGMIKVAEFPHDPVPKAVELRRGELNVGSTMYALAGCSACLVVRGRSGYRVRVRVAR